ncbi:hypothetical protein D3C72_1477610 [compost metagenome]
MLFQQEQGVQSRRLGREHGADVFYRSLQVFECLCVFGLDLGGHRFLGRTVSVEPVQRCLLAINADLGNVGALGKGFPAQAHLLQAIGGNSEFFDLIAWQLQRLGGTGEGFFDLFLCAAELDPRLEHGQLADCFTGRD